MCGSFHLSIDMGSSWWREIIVFQPSFWSSLLINLFAEPVLDIISILRVCLACSGTIPMRLHLDIDSIELTLGLRSALDDLARHADRWKKFQYVAPVSPSLNYILKQARDLTENPFSIFDALLIRLSGISADGVFGNSFIHCPRLHYLLTTHLRATDTVELTHLVNLRTQLYQGCSFAILLEKCPVLETLTVNCINDPVEDYQATPIRIPHVCHTHLRTLELAIHKYHVAGAWQSVQLPGLTHLRARHIHKRTFCDVKKQRCYLTRNAS
ncbi:hypothetical protein BT96DRAFT_539728 [Gymnopus androsaceus JB14]|uniref:F-box domain-containing protein n=1 Tax=Gymnopus androsaceus JB14 TaxID=1447944 RepID=A0A6A4GKU3_9AGAR|nr:hypothetical protein BT96DRAFT_539728 [Gymnopus androsaceus JB14]